jgi:hypothetical protein
MLSFPARKGDLMKGIVTDSFHEEMKATKMKLQSKQRRNNIYRGGVKPKGVEDGGDEDEEQEQQGEWGRKSLKDEDESRHLNHAAQKGPRKIMQAQVIERRAIAPAKVVKAEDDQDVEMVPREDRNAKVELIVPKAVDNGGDDDDDEVEQRRQRMRLKMQAAKQAEESKAQQQQSERTVQQARGRGRGQEEEKEKEEEEEEEEEDEDDDDDDDDDYDASYSVRPLYKPSFVSRLVKY